MGAFFLFATDTQDLALADVAEVFAKKGFAAPEIFDLGSMTLWLYRKQLVNEPNYVLYENGAALYATGTVIYKGLSYRETLQAVLQDYCRDCLDLNALLGNFALIFYVDGQVKILVDRLCAHHLFMDEAATRLSTSFLALLVSFPQPQPLNRMAFYEKIATGYIVAPDTLISTIEQITPRLQETTKNQYLTFLMYPPVQKDIELCTHGFDECVERQLANLIKVFNQIVPLARDYGADLGISGGYDSRLMFLLAQHVELPIALHTHLTANTPHEIDCEIVKKIADLRGTILRVVPTKRIVDYDEDEVAKILLDGLYYYDGRNGHNMGAFSETYTRDYKIRTLGENRLSLNGKAGEIYRNYYFTSRRRFDFRQWMRNHVYFSFAEEAIPDRMFWDSLHHFVINKMQPRLDVDLTGDIDLLTMRRYYGEIRAPDCDANINNAHNQLAFYFVPFQESAIIRAAYAATPYIGLSGKFEAAMLTRLDPEIAGMDSHYGFPLNREPLTHVIYSALRGYLPDWVWLARETFLIRYRGLRMNALADYLQLRKRSETIREIEMICQALIPAVRWDILMRDIDARATMIFVGSFLREFGNHIRAEFP